MVNVWGEQTLGTRSRELESEQSERCLDIEFDLFGLKERKLDGIVVHLGGYLDEACDYLGKCLLGALKKSLV